jgi:hypothetical protein
MDEVQKYFASKSLNPEDSDQPIDAIVENLIKDLYTKHQRKKVWLLLDNYDMPMIRAIKQGFIDAPEIKDLYAKLIPKSWLYSEHIAKVVVMGQHLIDIPGTILAGSDNLSLVKLLNQESSQYFGFT